MDEGCAIRMTLDLPLFNAAESQRRRDGGIASVELNATLWHNDWVSKARYMAVQHARIHGSVCADDIHRICPLPSGLHHNAFGAIWRTKELVCVDWKKSERPDAHARRIGIYKYAGNV